MRCKECGAILLDTDTFCGKCGTKVQLNICPKCGETLRLGMRFCSSCGYEVVGRDEYIEQVDDDIPVTGGLKTTEIPFDLIEQSIIRDVERQLDVPVMNNSSKVDDGGPRIFSTFPNHSFSEDEAYTEDMYDSYESDDGYDDYPEEYEDYVDEDYEDSYVDEEDNEGLSLGYRILVAGIVVIGIVILLIIAVVFFKTRDSRTGDNHPVVEESTDEDEVDDETPDSTDNTIGTIEIISNVNIRSTPDSSTDSNKIGMAIAGETYKYYGFADNSDNWIHIKIDDNTDGYVFKKFIKINE